MRVFVNRHGKTLRVRNRFHGCEDGHPNKDRDWCEMEARRRKQAARAQARILVAEAINASASDPQGQGNRQSRANTTPCNSSPKSEHHPKKHEDIYPGILVRFDRSGKLTFARTL